MVKTRVIYRNAVIVQKGNKEYVRFGSGKIVKYYKMASAPTARTTVESTQNRRVVRRKVNNYNPFSF